MKSYENVNPFFDEIPKYRKKKTKKNKKSNHKHKYDKEVLIRRETNYGEMYTYARLCSICDKVGEERLFETERVKDLPFRRMLSQEEILEKYRDLPVIQKK